MLFRSVDTRNRNRRAKSVQRQDSEREEDLGPQIADLEHVAIHRKHEFLLLLGLHQAHHTTKVEA